LISPPRERFNEFRLVAAIAQGLPDFQDIFLDDFGVYVRFRPECPEYLVLRYEPIRVLDKIAQYVESLRGERHAIFPAPQTVVNDVEPEGMELLHFRGPTSLFTNGNRLRAEAISVSLRY
jgi:hypothetical protein